MQEVVLQLRGGHHARLSVSSLTRIEDVQEDDACTEVAELWYSRVDLWNQIDELASRSLKLKSQCIGTELLQQHFTQLESPKGGRRRRSLCNASGSI